MLCTICSFSVQVDLQAVRNVTGLATQGYVYGSVTSYQIMYSVNGKQWFQYKDNSTMKSKVCIHRLIGIAN